MPIVLSNRSRRRRRRDPGAAARGAARPASRPLPAREALGGAAPCRCDAAQADADFTRQPVERRQARAEGSRGAARAAAGDRAGAQRAAPAAARAARSPSRRRARWRPTRRCTATRASAELQARELRTDGTSCARSAA
ncbi:MAG: hypothetical protein MZW92_52315 [Comamonadaceae bacterium]|nr:hypothetical protein [Comamonadaceae bacterium]